MSIVAKYRYRIILNKMLPYFTFPPPYQPMIILKEYNIQYISIYYSCRNAEFIIILI